MASSKRRRGHLSTDSIQGWVRPWAPPWRAATPSCVDVRDTRCSSLPCRCPRSTMPRVHRSSMTVSSTWCRRHLRTTSWRNSALARPYSAQTVRALKDSVEGGICVSGSGTLVRALLAGWLVDELHVFTYPLVIGGGPRLHVQGELTARWSFIANESYGNGVVYLDIERSTDRR